MKVRTLTQMSFVNGDLPAGSIIDLAETHARALLDAPQPLVQLIDEESAPTLEEPEATTLADAPERATMPRAKKRGE